MLATREELAREIAKTRKQLEALEAQYRMLDALEPSTVAEEVAEPRSPRQRAFESSSQPQLTKVQVERFSRQIMVDAIGAAGMARISTSTVLLVGCGGLGSTVALYLAAAGVGKLILVDFDDVELSNLHRQVIHTTARVGTPKVGSARMGCEAVNPHCTIECISSPFGLGNAEQLARRCDVIVDATDNVAARYLVNDAAVLAGKPLVSGSAMRWEGQLSVYNYRAAQGTGGDSCFHGPCYRCMFPVPPPMAAVGSCNDTGVVGPVPGAIGCLQALEAIKVLCDGQIRPEEIMAGRMLLMDGRRGTYRVVRLRPRQAKCVACGVNGLGQLSASSVAESPLSSLAAWAPQRPEYVTEACTSGAALSIALLPEANRMSARDFCAAIVSMEESTPIFKGEAVMILDVRVSEQFHMAHIPGSVSLPLPLLRRCESSVAGATDGAAVSGCGAYRNQELQRHWHEALSVYRCQTYSTGAGTGDSPQTRPKPPLTVCVLCRRGVASAQATHLLLPLVEFENGLTEAEESVAQWRQWFSSVALRNVDGGLNQCSREGLDFPFY